MKFIEGHPNGKQQGFTLIELVIAMTLIAIFATFGLVNFQKTTRTKQVENAAARLRQAYISARSSALAGKKNCRVCGAAAVSNYACGTGDTPLLGWEVIVNTSAAAPTFTIQGVCGNGGDPSGSSTRFSMDGGVATVRAESLPTNLTYSISGPPTIVFRPSTGGLYPSMAAGSVLRVTVTHPVTAEKRSFTVSGDGLVSEITP